MIRTVKKLQEMNKAELIAMIETRQSASCASIFYPNGLIGQKVRYRKVTSRKAYDPSIHHPLPECGYFVIKGAYLTDYGVVIVQLDGGVRYPSSINMWDIGVRYLEPVEQKSSNI